ncbi:MAG: hypothetical protein D3923_18585, partial [Candidatus Electrothrix sp. AR3]|nr:hypothetical protein [Candidatus Electrothrix sp. AR3]
MYRKRGTYFLENPLLLNNPVSSLEKAMKSSFLALLILFFLTPLFASADEYTLATLEKESKKITTKYASPGNVPARSKQADLLLQAAKIMIEQQQCTAALPLYKQAALFTTTLTPPFWIALAEAASCAQQWPLASQTAWLAYLASKDDTVKKNALTLVGTALEKRTAYYANWTPVAITIYERLKKIGGSLHAKQRLARLEKKQAAEQTLTIQKSFVDTSSGRPKLCFNFNDQLIKTNKIHYADYIRIKPSMSA